MRFIALIKVDSVYVYSDTYYKLPEEPNLIRLKKKKKKGEKLSNKTTQDVIKKKCLKQAN